VKSYGFIVEYIEGKTLKTMHKNGEFVEEAVYEDILRSIIAMAAFGFTHKNIQGRNIILRENRSHEASSIVFIDLSRNSIEPSKPCSCNADNVQWKWPLESTHRHVGEGPPLIYRSPEFYLFRAYLKINNYLHEFEFRRHQGRL
jgi:tRNA A-37 threonylcarbamoyl transferase component Bud32